jgi:hypothetical protein
MKLLIVSKLPGTHKTGTMMLSYLYDVVKPLKSIFFSFICMLQRIAPRNIHTQVLVNNTLNFKPEFP